ncbi:hypothetical protein [Ornithinimicrobium pratense]|uniref:DUF3558 domain-containing protein n=1 Tax=Ornithinimicrobium pratense TaxID=2593973 RepID=A0A5J6V3V6_9MICO|nr:hypothetical protein [Ornithinimicrobium pratense]QFG68405.1 hypothetical protein FY030_06475 [Ornithinimicrobium pratense]
MRIAAALVGLGSALFLVACANQSGPTGDGSAVTGTATSAPPAPQATAGHEPEIVDLSNEVVLAASPYQRSVQDPVVLCFGPKTAIYPPDCIGPELEGAFSWADHEVQQEDGITWTDDTVYAIGHYAPEAGEQGTFTLTRPLNPEPPAGYDMTDWLDTDFTALCEDPTADVAGVDQAGRTQGPAGMDEEQALLTLLRQDLTGYATSWVSDGGVMNVLLTEGTDLDASRAVIRDVYTGPLCLETRNVPSDQDLRAAQDAVAQRSDLRFHSVGSGGTDPRLYVEVVVADRATVDAIYATAQPWLAPDQIVIVSAVQALQP